MRTQSTNNATSMALAPHMLPDMLVFTHTPVPVRKARSSRDNLSFDFGADLTPVHHIPKVDLTKYHVILLNHSGGKDGQAMLDVMAKRAKEQGVSDRVHVVHADLGRAEWKGTKEIAKEHADHYGFPFHVVKRPQGDLLQHIEERGMWPSRQARYCTSDHKEKQVTKLITHFVNERWHKGDDKINVLNCMGIRAAESPERAKKPAFKRNEANSNGKRNIDTYFPIHHWSVGQVWDRIHQAGTKYHHAYDLGMPRLSCPGCVFSSKPALMIAAKHNPELFDHLAGMETRMNHKFRPDLSIKDLNDAVKRGEEPGEVKTWEA